MPTGSEKLGLQLKVPIDLRGSEQSGGALWTANKGRLQGNIGFHTASAIVSHPRFNESFKAGKQMEAGLFSLATPRTSST